MAKEGAVKIVPIKSQGPDNWEYADKKKRGEKAPKVGGSSKK